MQPSPSAGSCRESSKPAAVRDGAPSAYALRRQSPALRRGRRGGRVWPICCPPKRNEPTILTNHWLESRRVMASTPPSRSAALQSHPARARAFVPHPPRHLVSSRRCPYSPRPVSPTDSAKRGNDRHPPLCAERSSHRSCRRRHTSRATRVLSLARPGGLAIHRHRKRPGLPPEKPRWSRAGNTWLAGELREQDCASADRGSTPCLPQSRAIARSAARSLFLLPLPPLFRRTYWPARRVAVRPRRGAARRPPDTTGMLRRGGSNPVRIHAGRRGSTRPPPRPCRKDDRAGRISRCVRPVARRILRYSWRPSLLRI